jgi:hypothetical protein
MAEITNEHISFSARIMPRVVILNEVKDLAYTAGITQALLRDHVSVGEIPRLRSG